MECMALVRSIRFVLTMAIRHGGTTLRNYVGAGGEPIFPAKALRLRPGRKTLPDLRTKIKQRTQGQRSTYFCPSCQV